MQKLSAVPASKTTKSGHYHQGVPLEEHAASLFPGHAHNQAAWVSAIKYLRRGRASIWALDKLVFASSTPRY